MPTYRTTPDRPCLDCGRLIWRKSGRCRSCANKLRWQDADDPRREKLHARNAEQRIGDCPYEDREWLRVRYEDRAMTLRQIAGEAHCAVRTIARWMRTHAIPTRDNKVAIGMAARFGPANSRWKGGPPVCPKCGGTKAFTSRVCMACDRPRRTGPTASNYKGIADIMVLVRGWVAEYWRPAVYARDAYTCQRCGDSRGGNLQAHHREPLALIVARKQREWRPSLITPEERLAFIARLIADDAITAIENGETLCETCHRNLHRGSRIRAA